MATKYLPILLRHSPTPKVEHFAVLAGLDACVRGMLISVMPLVIYDAVLDAGVVSRIYFVAGVVSLIWGLMVPWITGKVPRRWVYSFGALLYPVGMVFAILGGPVMVPLSLMCNAMATVTVFVCLNAYVLDYVARADLGRGQSLQMVYAATPWMAGPLLGVWLHHLWAPLPFIAAAVFSMCMLTAFWILRLGNGKQISRAKKQAVNPLAFLSRFFQQPRLIAGWFFAVIRSCGWWVYVVYLPIFCVEAGLGDKIGGMVLSASNSLLFISPFMLRFATKTSLRRVMRVTLFWCAVTFILATAASPLPWVTVVLLSLGSIGLVMLDATGGLPFMMSVKPSERSEMAAVYSSFRDVSGIATPGVAYLVLLAAPLAAIFAASGVGFAIAFAIAGYMHPRLGTARPSHGGAVRVGVGVSPASVAQ
ncbi:MAG: MFS transporter [Albidovulum sp.]